MQKTSGTSKSNCRIFNAEENTFISKKRTTSKMVFEAGDRVFVMDGIHHDRFGRILKVNGVSHTVIVDGMGHTVEIPSSFLYLIDEEVEVATNFYFGLYRPPDREEN
jgi:cobalamin biosynthesis Co2+ chelatase CbiK